MYGPERLPLYVREYFSDGGPGWAYEIRPSFDPDNDFEQCRKELASKP